MCYFNICGQGLTSLVGIDFPPNITVLNCEYNQLTTLEGVPNSLRELYCNNNQLTTLEGVPNSLRKIYCGDNQLTTLEGAPLSVLYIHCVYNQLTSLAGLPNTCQYIDYNNNPCYPYTDQELDKFREDSVIKNYQRGIEKINNILLTRLHYLIYNLWHTYWYDERDDKGHSRACKYVAKQLINN